MAKVFETNFEQGSCIDRINKTAFSNSANGFSRTEKGLAMFLGNEQIDIGELLPGILNEGSVFVIVKDLSFVANHNILNNSYFMLRTSQGGNAKFLFSIYDGAGKIMEATSSHTVGQFHTILGTWDGTNIELFINNVSQGTTLAGVIDTGTGQIRLSNNAHDLDGYIAKVIFYSHKLFPQERQDLYEEFLNTSLVLSNKFPKYGRDSKPVNDDTPGTLIHYNCIPQGSLLTDITNNEGPSGIHGPVETFNGISFDGIDDYVSVNLPLAPAATVKTICFRAKLASTTEMIYEGQSNALLILANAGTLQATDYDHIYINGVEDATVHADQWMNVVVTSSTVVDNNTPSLGYNSGTFAYGEFELEDFKISDKEFALQDAVEYHNSFARRITLDDDWNLDAVGNLPLGWNINSGTFTIAEDATSKYLSCTGDGTISFRGIALSSYKENGWIKKFDGDLSGDAGDTVDNATNVAFANNTITLTMTAGQKVRNIVIQQGEEQ